MHYSTAEILIQTHYATLALPAHGNHPYSVNIFNDKCNPCKRSRAALLISSYLRTEIDLFNVFPNYGGETGIYMSKFPSEGSLLILKEHHPALLKI